MIDVMVTAYLECALWTKLEVSDDSDELFRDNFTIDDFSQETKDKAKECCEHFLSLAKDFLPQGVNLGQVGHDFWLTRNRGGSGFWGRPDYVYGIGNKDKLTAIAHKFHLCVIVNDNGVLHII